MFNYSQTRYFSNKTKFCTGLPFRTIYYYRRSSCFARECDINSLPPYVIDTECVAGIPAIPSGYIRFYSYLTSNCDDRDGSITDILLNSCMISQQNDGYLKTNCTGQYMCSDSDCLLSCQMTDTMYTTTCNHQKTITDFNNQCSSTTNNPNKPSSSEILHPSLFFCILVIIISHCIVL